MLSIDTGPTVFLATVCGCFAREYRQGLSFIARAVILPRLYWQCPADRNAPNGSSSERVGGEPITLGGRQPPRRTTDRPKFLGQRETLTMMMMTGVERECVKSVDVKHVLSCDMNILYVYMYIYMYHVPCLQDKF